MVWGEGIVTWVEGIMLFKHLQHFGDMNHIQYTDPSEKLLLHIFL